MLGMNYILDVVIWIIALLLSGKTWDSTRKGLSKIFVKVIFIFVFLGAGFLFTAYRHKLFFFAPSSEGGETAKGVGRSFSELQASLPSLFQFLLALAALVVFYFLYQKARLPKEWSSEKDENGKVVKEPTVRLTGLISCVVTGLSLSLIICWPTVWYFWVALVIGFFLDTVFIVPYLQVYAVLVFQKPVKFWSTGLHVFLPTWLPKHVFDILSLARERIEATHVGEQLPTADTPSAESAEADKSLSTTISLVSWLVFWTNDWPEKYINFSRADRDQLKTMVFNIIEAFEAEILLELPFAEARTKKDYFLSIGDLRAKAEEKGKGAEFERLYQAATSDAEWQAFALKVLPHTDAFKRFLALRSRIRYLVGVLLEDIKVKDRNARPEVEDAIKAVTLAHLKRQEAEIAIGTGEAEGQAISKRDTEALKGVLNFLLEGNNAAAMAVWTDFQRATNNRNIAVGGVDIANILANLTKKSS